MTRGRKPNVEPSSSINLHLPESIRTRLDLLLFSSVQNRVPQGAYRDFFLERLAEFFSSRSLETRHGPIRGSAETLAAIEAELKETQ